jgi:large subunit ribosomal protein L36e
MDSNGLLQPDLIVGINKGHPTTALPKRVKPSHRKGALSQKTKFVRSIVREVAGFSPYERRVMELLRNSKVRLAVQSGESMLSSTTG